MQRVVRVQLMPYCIRVESSEDGKGRATRPARDSPLFRIPPPPGPSPTSSQTIKSRAYAAYQVKVLIGTVVSKTILAFCVHI
jgi:hypothetical protein